ncbi:metal ABC transporter permease [Brevibacillus sp. 7WMA2]|uniref:ABC-type Mn2+/Zn2+ transport system, permease n=1 Tax=Brevibacillus laterosporus LMG 15441 TaxID=1042163 RepID=A0A075QZF1_BRELA|nr:MULTISPECIES: metal ABC transporter permease [Brevibacillus]HAS02201.1 metal ABC transporter permease [Brevibacillus sp.]AIG25722.1 ABC-type Mn2+/Zn2+ transport system, permease [Brevibacillus laterosporus LMG 15441]MBA4531068.1 metal ABC transporter permease [Brevibacillus halotolerans]MCR8965144.1 metal ABC transporter permease [Brevibacillus laterosporus]MCR8996925.1 metal ABC transporter permease [Brevibacillus laterosporus]
MNSFWIILTGSLVAATCGFLGCFLILRRMAMLGDAISHAILPGIALAFLITNSRETLPMLIGAGAFGLLTVFLIQLFRNSGVKSDAAIGVTFTALFSIGVVIISLFSSQVDLDLDCVLYGEIAYVPWDTLTIGDLDLGPRAVWGIGIVFLVSLLVISLFYKQFKLCTFDPAMAAAIGIPVALFHYLLMGLVSMATVASFESVGAILVVAMLVVPGATAYLLTDRLPVMLGLSMLIGVLCSALGYALATWLDSSIAGAMTVIAGLLFALAFIFSPRYGLISKLLARRSLRVSEQE